MICIVTQQKPTQNYKTVPPIKNTSINFLKSNLVLLPECQHCMCVCVCVCVCVYMPSFWLTLPSFTKYLVLFQKGYKAVYGGIESRTGHYILKMRRKKKRMWI